MKNADLWAQYNNFTKDLSDNIRKLGFASAAISWLFRGETNAFPEMIKLSLGFVVLFFLFDIAQYFLGAILVKFWTEFKENEFKKSIGTIEGEYYKPLWLDYPSFICWFLKCLALLISYLYLGLYIFR